MNQLRLAGIVLVLGSLALAQNPKSYVGKNQDPKETATGVAPQVSSYRDAYNADAFSAMDTRNKDLD